MDNGDEFDVEQTSREAQCHTPWAIRILQSLVRLLNYRGNSYVEPTIRLWVRTRILSRYYHFLPSLLLNTVLPDLWLMEADLLLFTDENRLKELLNRRENEFNLIGLTASIVATLAMTSLQLVDLENIHWTARAFWTATLVLSLISVYISSEQQRTISRLLRPEELQHYMATKKDVVLGTNYRPHRTPQFLERMNYLDNTFFKTDDFEFRKEGTEQTFIDLPSISSVLLIASPRLLLSFAVNAFIVGLGIYQCSLWIEAVGHKKKNSSADRNVFIVYAVAVFVCYLIYFFAKWTRVTQSRAQASHRVFTEIERRRLATWKLSKAVDKKGFREWRTENEPWKFKQYPKKKLSKVTSPPADTIDKEEGSTDYFQSKHTPTASLVAALNQAHQIAQEQAKVQEKLIMAYRDLAMEVGGE